MLIFWEKNLGKGFKSRKEEFCGKSPRDIPLTNRSYIEQKHIHMAKTLAAYQLSLDLSKNIRGRTTTGLNGYFQSLSKSQSVSREVISQKILQLLVLVLHL